MEPNQFRESRIAINRLCNNIVAMIVTKDMEKAKGYHNEATEQLKALRSQAEGEIQERSVKNLKSKVNMLSMQIKKLKPAPSASKKKKASAIVWNEEAIGNLSAAFLAKALENMGSHENAAISFGTSGKGIRPSYQISLGPDKVTAYSGSSHKPLAKTISTDSGKLSTPFARQVIEKALNQQQPSA